MSWLIALKVLAGRLFAWLGSLNVWQFACIGLALLGAFQLGEARHFRKLHEAESAQLEQVCAVTKLAARSPRLACRDVVPQILETGRNADTLIAALNHQTGKITAFLAVQKVERAQADAATKAALSRIKRVDATRAALDRSARGKPTGAKCLSPTLKGAWQ